MNHEDFLALNKYEFDESRHSDYYTIDLLLWMTSRRKKRQDLAGELVKTFRHRFTFFCFFVFPSLEL